MAARLTRLLVALGLLLGAAVPSAAAALVRLSASQEVAASPAPARVADPAYARSYCRVEVVEAPAGGEAPRRGGRPCHIPDLGSDSLSGWRVVSGVVETIEAVPIADGAGRFTAYRCGCDGIKPKRGGMARRLLR